MRRDALKVRVKRHHAIVWEGRVLQLRQEKQVLEQVSQGNECGILLDGFEDFEVGDIVEVVELQERRIGESSASTGAANLRK